MTQTQFPGHIPGDLTRLLHPAEAFASPAEVLQDPDLTTNEKRAILASWASDACAVEACPELRQPPGSRRPVAVDDILAGLRSLDQLANREGAEVAARRWKRELRRFSIDRFREARKRGYSHPLPPSGKGPSPRAA